jgi:signal transduction histidine kinase
MNLKQRFSLVFSCLFSLLMAAVMLTVYYLFARFRQEEFFDRLAEKAETTARLLVDVKEINYDLQRTIDRNSVTRLYNEKTQVFDEEKKRIYSSNDTINIKWTDEELDLIKREGKIFERTKQYDVLGLYYESDKKDYYVLISAEDTYGNRKLVFLKYLLLGAFIISTISVFLLSFIVSKKSLQPLDNFRKQIQDITDNDLTVRLSKAKREDEINALANSFNQLMDRIDNAYTRQREFTGSASHELRTPVARITMQLENLLQVKDLDPAVKSILISIAEDAFQLSEIISSLIALANINNQQNAIAFIPIRLDEMIFSAAAEISKNYPDFKLKFEIENTTSNELDIEVQGDETLIKMVMLNLLKNAFVYSADGMVDSLIRQTSGSLQVIITNKGEVPDVSDASVLFNTFYRGSNTHNKAGSGIGLSIVKRVLQYHHASIIYQIPDDNTNQVMISFPIQETGS